MTRRLIVLAHPDDELYAAGSIAHWASQGDQVYMLSLTKGGNGTSSFWGSRRRLKATRRAEFVRSAQILGATATFTADFRDGRLANNHAMRRVIIDHIRLIQPDLVVTWDPQTLYHLADGTITHPDHLAVGAATLASIYPYARDVHNGHTRWWQARRSSRAPHRVAEVLLFGGTSANYVVDITSHVDAIRASIEAHASQASLELTRLMSNRAAAAGARAGYAHAEEFNQLKLTF